MIVLAELPDYREVKRIPFSRESALTIARRDGTLVMPVNRKAFAYFYENDIVYGSTADLGVTWTTKADPSVTIWNIAISPNADFVALYVSETQGMAQPRTHTVQVLSGKDGSLVGTVPVDPLQALAISPDGKLLAAALRDPQKGFVSGTQPTLQVFDVASGKKLSTVIVDEFKLGSGEMFPVNHPLHAGRQEPDHSARSAKLYPEDPSPPIERPRVAGTPVDRPKTTSSQASGASMKYAVLFEQTATGFSAHVPDLPGCVAAGATLAGPQN